MDFRRSFAMLFFILAISIVHLGIYTRNINLKYEVEGLKRTLNKLQAETRHLSSLAAEHGNLERIESIAVNKLHMIRPQEMNYVKSSTSEVNP
jgi:cell division protein FtsL